MEMKHFPTINLEATGKHIAQLRKERGLSVKDLQYYFGFDAPQAIYKWQSGTTLPTVDNLLALSVLLEVSIDSILVTTQSNITLLTDREPEGSVFLPFFKNLKSGCRVSTATHKNCYLICDYISNPSKNIDIAFL